MKKLLIAAISTVVLFSMSVTVFAEDIDNPIIPDSGTQNGQLVASSSNPTLKPDEPTTNTPPVTENKPTDVFGDQQDLATSPDAESKPPAKDYVSDLFGDVDVRLDNSYARPINAWIKGIVSVVMSIVMVIFPSLLVLNTTIDVMCIAFKPIMLLFANLVPFQCFSTEVTDVTGIAFAGDKSGASTTVAADLGTQNRLVYYLKKRMVIAIFATLVLVLMASGIWFKLLSALINGIVGVVMSMI